MKQEKSHNTNFSALCKRWGATPVTDPNVLEGMAEYNRVLYSLDDKEYELLVNSASEPELYYKYLHEMQEKRK